MLNFPLSLVDICRLKFKYILPHRDFIIREQVSLYSSSFFEKQGMVAVDQRNRNTKPACTA